MLELLRRRQKSARFVGNKIGDTPTNRVILQWKSQPCPPTQLLLKNVLCAESQRLQTSDRGSVSVCSSSRSYSACMQLRGSPIGREPLCVHSAIPPPNEGDRCCCLGSSWLPTGPGRLAYDLVGHDARPTARGYNGITRPVWSPHFGSGQMAQPRTRKELAHLQMK